VKPKYRPSPSQIFPKFPVQLFSVVSAVSQKDSALALP
jgi:hypothetical protein